MKIRINAERCEGHGRCLEVAPDLVEEDDRGRGSIADPDATVPPELEEQARTAARVCPERAVELVD